MSTQPGTPATGSGDTQGTQQPDGSGLEYTTIENASVGDLDAFLSISDDDAGVYSSEESQTAKPEPQQNQPQQGGDPALHAELERISKELATLKRERETLESRNHNAQKLIGKQGAELGKLRQQVEAVNAQLSAGLQEKLVTDPVEAMRDFNKIQENERQLEAIEQEAETSTKRERILEIARQTIPEDVSVDDMALVLKRDGVPDDYIERFKKDPIHFTNYDHVSLTLLGKRAAEQRAIVALGTAYQHAAAKVQELEAKLKAVPTDMLQRIHNAGAASKSVVSGGAHSNNSSRSFDLTSASNDALEQLLRQPG